MPNDPLSFLQHLLTRDFTLEQYAKGRKKSGHKPLVITLSRDYGALGETIAKQLADCLGIPVYDQEILEKVAKHANTDKFYLAQHDEQDSAIVSSFLYSLVTGTAATLETYRRHLYAVIAELARKDCLIIGRGAHLILSGKNVFRVRIVGSKLVCANRIAAEFNTSVLEAEHKVFEINNKRHKSIVNLFGENFENCSLEHAKNFDLILNTDKIPAEAALPILLVALQQFGFDLKTAKAAT